MTYKFTYKCRLCGEVFTNAMTGNEDLAKVTLITAGVRAQVSKETLHACNDTDCGIADLVGYKGVED